MGLGVAACDSPVDDQMGTRDERCFRRHQERHGRSDLARLTDPAQRRGPLESGADFVDVEPSATSVSG